jgi:glycosyltransferase involved in cell wall biosynthesis
MPSFNYARYLGLAIKSVLSQSYSDLEVIIVDDCSNDGSREIAEEWAHLDDRVVLVRHNVNRGLAAARNSGLGVSSGEFVALCDADDVWLPNKLSTQMRYFKRWPELGLVHSDSVIIDQDGNLTGQRFSVLMHTKRQRASGNVFGELCERNFLCVPTVTLRREAVQYAGGFDVSLRSLEDWVCWTMVSRKYLFYYVDEALVQYRMHGASLSHDMKGMAQNRAKAIRLLLDSVSVIPRRRKAGMLYSLGISHLETEDPRAAISAFVESIGANPVHMRSWVRLCQAVFETATSWKSEVV